MAFAAIASRRGAVAEMDKSAIDMAKALARLSELTIFELREEWRRLHRLPPPMRLSRDLLIRGITYKLQERAYGGLSEAVARKLEQTGADPLSWGAAFILSQKNRDGRRRTTTSGTRSLRFRSLVAVPP
jgi:hypothetical protein